MILTFTYATGERIPTEDWYAYAPARKEKGDCLVVGCPNKADCDEHWVPAARQEAADRAYNKACHMAMAYCWGRGDMGDEVATDQANWYPFMRLYGKMQFDYAMETRGAAWSVRSAWEKFRAGEEL
ncbi:MAG: hypothetical protein ACXVYB_00255 [Arthrobacter sp.]